MNPPRYLLPALFLIPIAAWGEDSRTTSITPKATGCVMVVANVIAPPFNHVEMHHSAIKLDQSEIGIKFGDEKDTPIDVPVDVFTISGLLTDLPIGKPHWVGVYSTSPLENGVDIFLSERKCSEK